ncbi:MAG: type II toxin-antitoxin system VapC family toxin [Gammaproteobacteria bacterium]|nr:type II toxin-antitoxin system VapC family toxin [Gammaproteobacteria bacterium]
MCDTCALIWMVNNSKLNTETREKLNESYQMGYHTYISPITAWELGMLAAYGRIRLASPVTKWFDEYVKYGNYRLAEMSPRILIGSSYLPDLPKSDPADRIIIATARFLNLQIVTRDRTILRYAEKGYVRAMHC